MDEKREKLLSRLKLAMKVLAFAVIAAFFVSPFAELIHRWVFNMMNGGMYFSEKRNENPNYMDIVLYWELVTKIYEAGGLAVKLIIMIMEVYVVLGMKQVRERMKSYLTAAAPFALFAVFSVLIFALTQLRGASQYDLTGDPYRGENIFRFMFYPFIFFFCGMFIYKSGWKRGLLYLLMLTSVPLNIVTLIDKYVTPVYYFVGEGMSSVFYQFNHYGYYLVVVSVTAALLFVYEEKLPLKMLSLACFVLAVSTLIINDTLGAFLAAGFALVCFVVYSLIWERGRFKFILAVLGVFVLVTALCSFVKNDLVSSLANTVTDVQTIATNSEGAENAGTGRWGIWKSSVKFMLERPLYGWGIETLQHEYDLLAPHNEVLLYAVYFGIPVAVAYVAAVGFTMIRSMLSLKKVPELTRICFFVTIGYLASSMFGNTMHYTTPFMYCFLGLTYSGCAYNYLQKKSKTDDNSTQMNEDKSESVQCDMKKESL